MGNVLFMRKGETHSKPIVRLPEGYTELEYIESTGTQYIDTLFKPNQDTRVVVKLSDIVVSGSVGCLFGVSASGYFNLMLLANGDLRSDYGSETATFATKFDYSTPFEIDKNKNQITTSGANSYTHTATSFQTSHSLYLFARNTSGTANVFTSFRLYSCQIYDNGTLVRDYVPCINAAGEIGLYDRVGKKFYGNAGTGVFIGSEVAA